MQNTLVYELILAFDRSEVREFGRFLDSPYHNQRDDLRQLYQYLAECIHDLQVIPSAEQCCEKLWPGEVPDLAKLRLLQTYLIRLAEEFLLMQELRTQPESYQHHLLAAYRKKGLQRHFQKALRKQQKHLESTPFRHDQHYLAAYRLEQEQYHWTSTTGRTQELNIQSLEDQLHHTVLAMKLKQACYSLAHQNVYNAKYRLEMMDAILQSAAQPEQQEIPAVAVYYHYFLTLSYPDREDYFAKFKRDLLQFVGRFPREEMRDLYLLAINYCIRRLNANEAAFLSEALDLYQKGLENDLLMEKGHLSRFTYNNIVGIAIRAGEWQWAEAFVHQYQPHLKAEYRDVTFHLCAARLAFARKAYDQALQHLQKADYRDLINNMVGKILQLKIYYELQEFDLLHTHLKTTYTFVRRNKKISYHLRNYHNILQLTGKLLKLNPYDKAAKGQLHEQILEKDPLTEKDWLLEKLAEV